MSDTPKFGTTKVGGIHDPLCPALSCPNWADLPVPSSPRCWCDPPQEARPHFCECALIAKVRADEQAK